MTEDGRIASDPDPYCRCCWRHEDDVALAPGGLWAHGVWESLASLLDAPVQRAFDQHIAAHGCTSAARPPQPLDSCQVAWDLFFMTSAGRNAVWLAAAPHVDLAAHREDT